MSAAACSLCCPEGVVLVRRLFGAGVCGSAGVCFAVCLSVVFVSVGLLGGVALTGVCCVAFVAFVCLRVLCSGGGRCFCPGVCFCGGTSVLAALGVAECFAVGDVFGKCGCFDWWIASCSCAASNACLMVSSVHA